jgi:hypothetical protein
MKAAQRHETGNFPCETAVTREINYHCTIFRKANATSICGFEFLLFSGGIIPSWSIISGYKFKEMTKGTKKTHLNLSIKNNVAGPAISNGRSNGNYIQSSNRTSHPQKIIPKIFITKVKKNGNKSS